MAITGRFMDLDLLIRNIAGYLVDVNSSDIKLATSAKNICKLLYYTEKDPLSQPTQNRIDAQKPVPTFNDIQDVTEYIMNKRVLLVPRVPAEDERGSFIVVILDNFKVSENKQFKPHKIVFDVLVHNDDWLLNNSLRPYVIMQEIDNIFNNRKLSIGNVEFVTGDSIVLTPKMIGYSLVYANATFN